MLDYKTTLIGDYNYENGQWCKIIELRDNCEVAQKGFIDFTLFQSGVEGYYKSNYILFVEYKSPYSEHNANVNLMYGYSDSSPIQCCYVKYPNENKIIIYAKPSMSNIPITIRINDSFNLGCFKLLKYKNCDTVLSQSDIILPVTNKNTATFYNNSLKVSAGSVKCLVGATAGTFKIAEIYCPSKTVSNTLTILLNSCEGNKTYTVNSIINIYERVNSSETKFIISAINAENSNTSKSEVTRIGVSKIEDNRYGLYLKFAKTYSGVIITPLNYTVSQYSNIKFIEPVRVDEPIFEEEYIIQI